MTVGENGVKLLDFKFDFSAIDVISGEVQIQRLDSHGYSTDMWTYWKGQTRGIHKTEGWYNNADEIITTENQPTFPAGEGLYLGLIAGVKLTTSGEVLQKAVTITYDVTGNKVLSNPFPVALKLLDIQLGIDAIDVISGEVQIQCLDSHGYSTDMWTYWKGQTRGIHKTEGWYNNADEIITTANQPTFKAGEGLYFGGVEGMTVTFNPPTL